MDPGINGCETYRQILEHAPNLKGIITSGYSSAEDIQNIVYEIGKTAGFAELRDWFKALYETLLGSGQGPRMRSFIRLYGIANSRRLIAEALAKG